MEDVGKKGAAALIPELNHIKATGLWKSDLLTCVEPDILAADFLSYALQKYALKNETTWVFAALGFNHIDNFPMYSLSQRWHSLGRLIHDSQMYLSKSEVREFQWEWPIEALGKHLKTMPEACSFISEHCQTSQFDLSTLPLTHIALEHSVANAKTDLQKILHLNSLSNVLAARGYSKNALAKLKEAAVILEKYTHLNMMEKDSYLATILHNMAIQLDAYDQPKEALVVIQRAVGIHKNLAQIIPDLG